MSRLQPVNACWLNNFTKQALELSHHLIQLIYKNWKHLFKALIRLIKLT